jgi:hypothetical protein
LDDSEAAQHKFQEAESLFRRALVIQEKTRGPEHAEVFKTMSNLAEVYVLQGRYGDAEPLYIRCLDIGERALGAAHPDVVMTLQNYAELLRKMHKKAEARKVGARVRELRTKSDKDNPARFEVDWRDLQERSKG